MLAIPRLLDAPFRNLPPPLLGIVFQGSLADVPLRFFPCLLLLVAAGHERLPAAGLFFTDGSVVKVLL